MRVDIISHALFLCNHKKRQVSLKQKTHVFNNLYPIILERKRRTIQEQQVNGESAASR